MRLTLAVLLCLASISVAQEITLPAEVRGGVGDFVKVTAKTDGKVKWFAIDSDLKLFPVDLLKDSRTAVVTSQKPGTYRLLAFTAKGDEPSDPVVVVVVVSGANPKPPTPPEPKPQPKPVDDPFVKALREAYALERGDTKDGFRIKLIETYKHGVNLTLDNSINQVLALLTRLRVKRAELIPDSELTQVRFAIQQELDKHLPKESSAPLDAANRKKIADQFNRVIKALEAIQ